MCGYIGRTARGPNGKAVKTDGGNYDSFCAKRNESNREDERYEWELGSEAHRSISEREDVETLAAFSAEGNFLVHGRLCGSRCDMFVMSHGLRPHFS